MYKYKEAELNKVEFQIKSLTNFLSPVFQLLMPIDVSFECQKDKDAIQYRSPPQSFGKIHTHISEIDENPDNPAFDFASRR
jgi:hypothetical protein